MNHRPNELDVKTDLRRCVMASFAPENFEDKNFKTFLSCAQKNLDLIRQKIGERKFRQVIIRMQNASNRQNPIEKRREDLLTAGILI